MAGEANVCGTGPGNWPQPGDPNLGASALTATRVFNGIQLRWLYPTVNPEAVAHTKVFRNTVNNFGTALLHTVATGNSYLDPKIPGSDATQYWYWIQIVSVHGTVGDTIGPASAWMADNIADIIAMLEGEIGDSMLNEYLKERIDTITDVSSGLTVEQTERLLGDTALTDLWASIQVELADIDTLILSEQLARTTADSAQVATIDLILAKANENAAAILTEQSVRADADSANASLITTLQTTVNGHTNSLQVLATVDSELGAMYGVKTDVNGFVVGYGLYNSGSSGLFLVNANQFAIGTPDPVSPGVAPDITDLPFIVDSGNVYMKSAMIQDASITNAKIENFIGSDDYVFGSSGWGLFKDFFGSGSYAEFNNVRVRGNIEASSITAGSIDIIDTDMITLNAVTVPKIFTSARKTGNGGFQDMFNPVPVTVTLKRAGLIMIDIQFNQGYPGAVKAWGLKVTYNNTGAVLVNRSPMKLGNDYPSWVGAVNGVAGANTFKVEWYGQSSGVNASAVVRLIGAQR